MAFLFLFILSAVIKNQRSQTGIAT